MSTNAPTQIDHRLAALQEWLAQKIDSHFNIELASSDASFRRYFRVRQRHKTLIAMDAPPDHEDIRPFIDIAQRLQGVAIHAPEIHAYEADQGFMLLEDLGSALYMTELTTDTSVDLYHDAIDVIIRMQSKLNADDLPDFTDTLLRRELDLFVEWFLQKHLQIDLKPSDHAVLQQTFDLLYDNAREQPHYFTHRDYHSRNLIMLMEDNPGVLDFQDAVKGPITYDLASLIKDCYITWPTKKVYEWVNQYYSNAQRHELELPDQDTFIRWFELTGLQRHLKALFIFARLHHLYNRSTYLGDIPRTFRYVLDVTRRYPELADFAALLKDWRIKQQLDL